MRDIPTLPFDLGQIVLKVGSLDDGTKCIGRRADRQRVFGFSRAMGQAFDSRHNVWGKTGNQQSLERPVRSLFDDVMKKCHCFGLVAFDRLCNPLAMTNIGFSRLVQLARMSVQGHL